MHLLFVTPAFPPFPGGGERYVASLAAHLVKRGHQVTVVASNATLEQDFWQGTAVDLSSSNTYTDIHLVHCPIRPLLGGRTGLLAWRKLMVLLSMLPGDQTAILSKMAAQIPPIDQLTDTLDALNEPFDLVHGFNISWEYALLTGWHYAQQRQLPFVATPFAHLGTGHHDRVARNSTMDHQLHLLRQSDRVMVLTSIEADGLARFGIAKERLDVIGGGVDDVPLFPPTAVTRQKYQLHDPFIIFVGRASYEKGALSAAKATLQINQTHPLTLVLVGQQSPEFQKYHQQLLPHEKKQIRHLGLVSEEDKHSLLEAAELLLLPSRTDSFGIVFLEAWAHGIPVIGANAGGIPGVIDDGENGLLVEFGDIGALSQAIQHLINDDSMRHQMGQAGRNKLETVFTWDNVSRQVATSYHQLIKA